MELFDLVMKTQSQGVSNRFLLLDIWFVSWNSFWMVPSSICNCFKLFSKRNHTLLNTHTQNRSVTRGQNTVNTKLLISSLPKIHTCFQDVFRCIPTSLSMAVAEKHTFHHFASPLTRWCPNNYELIYKAT